MAVFQMHVDVAERSIAALIERDQAIVCRNADIGRHGDQQRQRRRGDQNQRQQHRALSLEIALKSIADTVANVLTANAEDTKRLNGTLNQLCEYAAAKMLRQGACHG